MVRVSERVCDASMGTICCTLIDSWQMNFKDGKEEEMKNCLFIFA